MFGQVAVETEPAKPAIGEVQMELFAQPPLRANAETVADDQHADKQFRIDRRPAFLAVERSQLLPQAIEFNEPVDQSQQVPLRHMPFERKLVKQSVLPNAAFPHHRLHSAPNDQSESATPSQRNP